MSSVAAWVSIGVAVAAAGTSAGMAASGVGQPNYPDIGASSREMANLQAQLLPYRRMLEAAAQQGGKVEIPGKPASIQYLLPGTGTVSQGGHGNIAGITGGTWVREGDPRLNGLDVSKLTTRGTPGTPGRTIDFSGYGAADVQAKIADEMAKLQLELSQKYDSQFIDQALEQEKLADPESFAAREKMNELIQRQINEKPERPVADLLDKQISTQLASARDGSLTPEMADILSKSVQDAIASRGGQNAGGDFSEPLTTGFEGEQRRAAARNKALAWEASGQTPEDVEYRREQQNLANLSSEVNGRTPQSQFASLSAAQSGPTPFNPGQPLPTMGPNQGAQLNQMTSQAMYGQAMNQGANPWATGLSAAMSTAGSLNKAGVI